MGYLGRRIGLSQGKGDSTPGGADGAVGGGILDLFAQGYFNREGNIHNSPGLAPSGLTATGGVISDYTDSSTVYRAHIFTSSGTFVVTDLGSIGTDVEYLCVAGGGGGGVGGDYTGYQAGGGGGGAGTSCKSRIFHTNSSNITESRNWYVSFCNYIHNYNWRWW